MSHSYEHEKGEILSSFNISYNFSHTQMIFRSVGVTQLYVQLDYEHSQNTYRWGYIDRLGDMTLDGQIDRQILIMKRATK